MTEPQEIQVTEDRLSFKKIQLNGLATVVAVITSAAALFVAWDQSRVMRAQQHGFVWPVVNMSKGWDQNNGRVTLTIDADNSGVGPALIKSTSYELDNRPLQTGELQTYLYEDIGVPEDFISSDMIGRGLAPSKNVIATSFGWSDLSPSELKALKARWSKLNMQACYCSVFDRCWIVSTITATQTSVKSCTTS